MAAEFHVFQTREANGTSCNDFFYSSPNESDAYAKCDELTAKAIGQQSYTVREVSVDPFSEVQLAPECNEWEWSIVSGVVACVENIATGETHLLRLDNVSPLALAESHTGVKLLAELVDVASPEECVAALRQAARTFYESHSELQSAWQDKNAGIVWYRIAKAIDACVTRCEREIKRS
jgi:hypothetical protein